MKDATLLEADYICIVDELSTYLLYRFLKGHLARMGVSVSGSPRPEAVLVSLEQPQEESVGQETTTECSAASPVAGRPEHTMAAGLRGCASAQEVSQPHEIHPSDGSAMAPRVRGGRVNLRCNQEVGEGSRAAPQVPVASGSNGQDE
ncbi:hypothetical protein Taro_032220 [Colocasia esculenta]|uniref:Uncharacterized protein n=1 Tax=Colocasia esculenta TaxID=4460 RepID=A0A843W8T8_COLES|nr:hypothetical protein [Colocasia esculenta]